MIESNSTMNIFSPTNSLLPNIILDSIGIGLCIIAICKTFLLILLIISRRQLIKLKEQILFLLSLNMYVNVFIFAIFSLDMFISMIKGHMNPNIPEFHNNTLWCRLKTYLSTIALISALYSNTLQALYRFFRIVYYTRRFFYQNIHFYLFCIVIQICLSALLQLPVLLLGHYDYEDYHCQVYLTNWRGILIGAFFVWLPPVFFTTIIYTWTMYYIHHNSLKFNRRRRSRTKRDFIVLRRIFWLIICIILFGTPACSTTIVYHLFGYIRWWANHLTWLTFISSFTGMSIVHTYYARHLRSLWSRTSNHILLTKAMTRITR